MCEMVLERRVVRQIKTHKNFLNLFLVFWTIMDVNQNFKDVLWDTPMEFDSESEDLQETSADLGVLDKQKISGIALWAFRRFFDNPEKDEPHVGAINFKKDGECLKVTFMWKDDSYPMFLSNNDPKKQYSLHEDEFEVPLSPMYHELRGKLMCLPQNMKIGKLQIENSDLAALENVLLEIAFFKRWTCETFEYSITRPFQDSYVLYRLLINFKPSVLIVQLQYGQHYFHKSGYASKENHFHTVTHCGYLSQVEEDTKELMGKQYGNPEYSNIILEIGKALNFGHCFQKTVQEMKQFADHLLHIFTPKKYALQKFILKCPSGDVDCGDFRKMWNSEKLTDFEKNEKIFVCVQRDSQIPEINKYSLSMEVSRFIFPMTDEDFLNFSRFVPFINIGFRVDISEDAVVKFIKEWQRGERDIEEIRLRLKNVINNSLMDKIVSELDDMKWIKVRRLISGKKKTLYLCRESMSHRILYIKSRDTSKL